MMPWIGYSVAVLGWLGFAGFLCAWFGSPWFCLLMAGALFTRVTRKRCCSGEAIVDVCSLGVGEHRDRKRQTSGAK